MATHRARSATFEDLRGRHDIDRLEVISGDIIEKAVPSADHSLPQGKVVGAVTPFNCKLGLHGPGGWWILPEIHVAYSDRDLFCHDVAGWRRERLNRPTGWPMKSRPDWVCEILSPGHEKRDLVDKARVLHAAEVPHYWIVNYNERTIIVHQWTVSGYELVQRARSGDTVRSVPFDAIELDVGDLLGDD